jgi:uncharacterized damage-inducible protein DinB
MPYPAKEYADAFIKHRLPLLTLLEKIPVEQATFTIREGALSILEMVNHLYLTDVYLLSVLNGEKFVPPSPAADLSSILATFKLSTPKVQAFLENLSVEQLNQEIKAFGQIWKAYRLIEFGREHEAHHKGQLWFMARALGIEPPMFYQF